MVRFKLVPYIVRVRKKYAEDFLTLDNINGKDFLNILDHFYQNIQSTNIFKEQQKTVSLEKKEKSQRNIFGILKSGEYGVEADFFNVETRKTTTQARKQFHSEVYPFFFSFHIPKETNRGFLILQNFKNYGIKTILERTLNEYLNPQNLNMNLNRLISHNLLNQIDKSRLVELKLIRYDVPKDIADQIYDGNPKEIIEERIFKIKRNKEFNLKRSLIDILSNTESTYFEILNEKYNEVKAIVIAGGSRVTLTFSEENILREFMPLNYRNIPLEGGFPKYDFLKERSKEYLNHLLESLGAR